MTPRRNSYEELRINRNSYESLITIMHYLEFGGTPWNPHRIPRYSWNFLGTPPTDRTKEAHARLVGGTGGSRSATGSLRGYQGAPS